MELAKENEDDCAPKAVSPPPEGDGDAPKAGADVEAPPKLKTMSEVSCHICNWTTLRRLPVAKLS